MPNYAFQRIRLQQAAEGKRHMPLAARIGSPLALFRKMERESYRAFHAKTPLHKADHFFNFCVTASSMRDDVLEHLGKIDRADKQPYFDSWAKVPALVAAGEISNSSKHFILRESKTGKAKQPVTRAVRMRKSAFVEFYVNVGGQLSAIQVTRSEVSFTLSDGNVLELYAFSDNVCSYWKKYLTNIWLNVRRQSLAHLSGS